LLTLSVLSVALVVGGSAVAFACGGLVAPGHAEVLEKATTLSAWHAGLEHYVTGFQFAGGAESFGYIVPLPGVPTKIEKGGDWTRARGPPSTSPSPCPPHGSPCGSWAWGRAGWRPLTPTCSC